MNRNSLTSAQPLFAAMEAASSSLDGVGEPTPVAPGEAALGLAAATVAAPASPVKKPRAASKPRVPAKVAPVTGRGAVKAKSPAKAPADPPITADMPKAQAAAILGRRIWKAMDVNGLKQRPLAQAAGVNKDTFNKIANGKSFPDDATLARIAKVLGITPDHLLSDAPIEATAPKTHIAPSSPRAPAAAPAVRAAQPARVREVVAAPTPRAVADGVGPLIDMKQIGEDGSRVVLTFRREVSFLTAVRILEMIAPTPAAD